jgi:hypothetical protein
MKKILLVENNEGDIENFVDRFRFIPEYEVDVEREFDAVIKHIERMKKQSEQVIAAFIDLHDDRKGTHYPGYDVIELVKKRFPDILVIAYTHLGKSEGAEAVGRGADAYYLKENISKLTEDWISRLEEKVRGKKRETYDHHFSIILAILNGLHESMRRIVDNAYRHDGRDGYKIEDEYDLQDLMWTILQPLFPKIKDEDPTPKHGGKSSRTDFYIPELKTILELKHIRKDSDAKKLQKQLSDDLMQYSKRQEAEYLIFYVLIENNVVFDFSPIRGDYNNEDYKYGEKTWKAIKFLDKKR